MNTKKELLDELRNIRMQIALTPKGELRDNLTNKANELHQDYGKVLFEEKTLQMKGRK